MAELKLERSPSEAGGWVITDFTAQGGVVADFPNAHYEDRSGIFLRRISDKLNKPPRFSFPLRLAALTSALQEKDPTREWLPVEIPSPREGYQFVLLHYRNRSEAFTVAIQIQGENPTAPLATLAIQLAPAVEANYHPTAALDPMRLQDAIAQAAGQALALAQSQGLVPGGALGDPHAIENALTDRFRLEGVRDTGVNYSAGAREGRAVSLNVQPVYIPAKIAIELANWAQLEDATKWDAPSIARLERKRHARESAIREELAGVLPNQATLVTRPLVAQWQNTELGKRYALAPVRYEQDTLVLGATDLTSRQDYEATVGASYGSTDGLQGTGGFHFSHARQLQLKMDATASYGSRARAFSGAVQAAPAQPVPGWTLNADGNFALERRDEAYFGPATPNTPLRWKTARGSAGFTATHEGDNGPPAAGKWAITTAFGLHATHTDDDFAASTTLPPVSDQPDSSLELKASARAATLLPGGKTKLRLSGQLRFAHALREFGGNYDYRLGEGELRAGAIRGAKPGHAWKISATTRAGRLDGLAPLSAQFRAGGDEGWIRGLREGELTGREYWAQSLAIGPEISALLGDPAAGGPTAFLLAGADYGQVRTPNGPRQSAHGYSLVVNLDAMPVAANVTADLSLGYAYSPDSRVDRHGAFFVRLDLPFGN